MNNRALIKFLDNNHVDSSNMIAADMEQLMEIIQGYEEKANATSGMVADMKRMFEEKLENMEKENNLLKEQFTKKDKIKRSREEETIFDESNKEEGDGKCKMQKKEEKSPKNSAE